VLIPNKIHAITPSNGIYDSQNPGGGNSAPALLLEDFSGYQNGDVFWDWGGGGQDSVIDTTHSAIGIQALKVGRRMGQPPGVCGGSMFYGGYVDLPYTVPEGNTVIIAQSFYIPASFSFGYVFGVSDTADRDTCRSLVPSGDYQSDGNGWEKWMVYTQASGTLRQYLELRSNRRDAAYQAGLYLNGDLGLYQQFGTQGYPLDQWFRLQMKVFVHSSAGRIDVWVDDIYVGYQTGSTISDSSNGVSRVGLGDYWNGDPYDDGVANNDAFWTDDWVVLCDMAGYGLPSDTDSGGRVYLPSTKHSTDFQQAA